MRTIAISGASGFIGSALTEYLEALGHHVRPLVRPGRQVRDGIAWDPERGEIDLAELEGVHALIHLAGENVADGRWTEAKKARIRASRVRGTELLANSLPKLREPPKVWVSGSATGFYGDGGSRELDESSGPGRDFLASVVVAWEEAAKPAVAAGIRVVHPRFGIVLSPEGGALAKMLTPFKLGLGGRLGSGEQYMSWIALLDAVRALVHLMDHEGLQGPFNVTAPEPVTNREFTRALGEALRRPTALPVPAAFMRLAFGEMADAALLSGARVKPRRLLESGFQFQHPALGELLDQLLA